MFWQCCQIIGLMALICFSSSLMLLPIVLFQEWRERRTDRALNRWLRRDEALQLSAASDAAGEVDELEALMHR